MGAGYHGGFGNTYGKEIHKENLQKVEKKQNEKEVEYKNIDTHLNKGEICDINGLKDIIDFANNKITESEKELKLAMENW